MLHRLNGIRFLVNMLQCTLYGQRNEGLLAARNNRFGEQLTRGSSIRFLEILTINSTGIIFNSEYCNGFRNRLVFAIRARNTEFSTLQIEQFKKESMNSKMALVYHPKSGSLLGDSKNCRGNLKYVSYHTRWISIYDLLSLNGKLNVVNVIH